MKEPAKPILATLTATCLALMAMPSVSLAQSSGSTADVDDILANEILARESFEGTDPDEAIIEPEKAYENERQKASEEVHQKLETRYGKRLLEFLEQNFPEAHEHLIYTLEEDPIKARAVLDNLFKMLRRYRHLAQKDPTEANIFFAHQRSELQTYEIAKNIRMMREAHKQGQAVSAEAIAAAEAQLEVHLNEAFTNKLKYQKTELQELEQEVAKLRKLLKFREQNRQQIINKRKEELLGTNHPLHW